MDKASMKVAAAKVIKSEADARTLAASLEQALAADGPTGFQTTRIAFNARADLSAFAIVDLLDRCGMFCARHEARLEVAWTKAVDAMHAAAVAPIAARLDALLAAWPKSAKLPAVEVLAQIVGSDAATVERLLDADTLEGLNG